MDLFGARQKQFLSFLIADAERETLDCVLQGMREVLGEEMPEEDAVRAYLYGPEKATTLSAEQQIVAIDKLLECAEVNFRMLCDLIRYQKLKEAGVVNSMEEIGTIYGVSKASVSKRLKKLHEKLRSSVL